MYRPGYDQQWEASVPESWPNVNVRSPREAETYLGGGGGLGPGRLNYRGGK